MPPQLRKLLVSVVALVVLYGGGNLVLVGAQNMLHAPDQSKLDTLKQGLDSERPKIDTQESQLGALGKKLDDANARLNQLKQQIDDLEQKYPKVMPPAVYAQYSQAVDSHNQLAAFYNADLGTYRNLYSDYTHQVDVYNSQVDQAKALAKQIGGTWYVVPVPRGESIR